MLRHVLYVRKSHEDDTRQQKSIGDQLQTMKELARREERFVAHTFTEEKSAKEPHKRPAFDEMIRLIQEGEADAILCYHVNRLTRNMVEGGVLQHLLTRRVIKEIRTASEVFRSGDNILSFILQTAMSTQYSLDLENIVRDRIAAKVARGEYPQRAPEGYANNPFLHAIERDEKRFTLVQRAFHLMATGTYSLERIARLMNEEWGYRTRQAFRTGGGPISRSTLHRMFHDPFYTGHFLYKGALHSGKHEAMISWETHEAVKAVLGRSGATRAKHRSGEFSFVGLFVCGVCGRRVTAEAKRGRHGRGNYVYYHCSNYSVCGQPSVREEVVEAEVNRILCSVAVDPALRALCVEIIERIYGEEQAQAHQEMGQQHRSLEAAEQRMSRLVQMGIKGLLTDTEFAREKITLQKEINSLRGAAAMSGGRLEKAREGALEVVEFVTSAPGKFAGGTPEQRREIAARLGAVYELKDGKVRIEMHPVLVPLLRDDVEKEMKTGTIEPQISGSGSAKADSFKSAVSPGCGNGMMLETLRRVFEILLYAS